MADPRDEGQTYSYCGPACDCAECYRDGTGRFAGQGPAKSEFHGAE